MSVGKELEYLWVSINEVRQALNKIIPLVKANEEKLSKLLKQKRERK